MKVSNSDQGERRETSCLGNGRFLSLFLLVAEVFQILPTSLRTTFSQGSTTEQNCSRPVIFLRSLLEATGCSMKDLSVFGVSTCRCLVSARTDLRVSHWRPNHSNSCCGVRHDFFRFRRKPRRSSSWQVQSTASMHCSGESPPHQPIVQVGHYIDPLPSETDEEDVH